MRLRRLRRLEEMELRREHDALMKERAALDDLLGVDPPAMDSASATS